MLLVYERVQGGCPASGSGCRFRPGAAPTSIAKKGRRIPIKGSRAFRGTPRSWPRLLLKQTQTARETRATVTNRSVTELSRRSEGTGPTS